MRAMSALSIGCLFLVVGLVGCDSTPPNAPDLAPMGTDGGTDDLSSPDGSSEVPAFPVWTACTGGSGAGDVTRAQLNFTVGDTSVVGVSVAPSGASVTFSYFSDDNH